MLVTLLAASLFTLGASFGSISDDLKPFEASYGCAREDTTDPSSPAQGQIPTYAWICGPDLSGDVQKLRIRGFTPAAGAAAKPIVVLGYGIGVLFDDTFALLEPYLKALAGKGRAAVLIEYPEQEGPSPGAPEGSLGYPDELVLPWFTGGLLFPPFADALQTYGKQVVCTEWQGRADAAKVGMDVLCGAGAIDCSDGIGLAGFSTGAGIGATLVASDTRVNAMLSTQWGPLFGAGQTVPLPDPPAGPGGTLSFGLEAPDARPHPCFVPPLVSNVPKEKRLSLISAVDTYFGNPTESDTEAAVAPVISLQKEYAEYGCPAPGFDCIAADGSGYYVVPPGDVPEVPGQNGHSSFAFKWAEPGGTEQWQATKSFEWLDEAAFGP